MAEPGAAISGFCRPSRVGPMLENGEIGPGFTAPLKLIVVFPLQSVQNRLLVHAATVMVWNPVPMALISSSVELFPVVKLPAPELMKFRHRSTSPLAAPSATAVNRNVQLPTMFCAGGPTACVKSIRISREPLVERPPGPSPFSTYTVPLPVSGPGKAALLLLNAIGPIVVPFGVITVTLMVSVALYQPLIWMRLLFTLVGTFITMSAPPGVANVSPWICAPRSLPEENTTIRPGPVIASTATSNAEEPSCGPNEPPIERLATAFFPKAVAVWKM